MGGGGGGEERSEACGGGGIVIKGLHGIGEGREKNLDVYVK